MKLSELMKNVPMVEIHADEEVEISAIAYDSRKVSQGCAFVAISGFASDGNRFIPQAMEKGAAVVITAKKPEQDVPYVLVSSDRLALAMMATNYYDHPAEKMVMVGITGTNGKTSSTLLLKQVLESKGAKVGLIGTMENMIGAERIATERTTPESLELQALFARMYEAGCTHVVMEVSSHALTLERVGGIHYDVAAFTNLTEDHLDFHKTMDAYCDAKAELFRRCNQAVINLDDAYAQRMLDAAQCPVIGTSASDSTARLYAELCRYHADGISFTAVSGAEHTPVKLGIPGKFTLYNALTVMGVAKALGILLSDCAEALGKAQGVKGRIEVVPTPGKDYTVLIDYAHTPDGLENVLSSVKDFCKGRLISVFGCGGDRDPMKRPIMGEIGVKYSDFAIISSDNPRTEDPDAIIADILKGVSQDAQNYTVVADRRAAIRYAMDIAQKDDIIVLAGKGHETYQEINGVKYHLDEREEVAAHLMEN